MPVTLQICPRFVGFFEGRSLITLDVAGRPAWLAFELAPIFNHAHPQALIDALTKHGPDPGIEQRDYDEVAGTWLTVLENELSELGVLDHRMRHAASIHILYMSGVERLVTRSNHLARHRLGNYLRQSALPRFDAIVAEEAAHDPAELGARIAQNRLELEKRRFESERLLRLVDDLEAHGMVDDEVLMAYRVVATELALGGDLSDLKPQVALGWLTPSEIAERYVDVSANRVGRVISKLGIRGAPGYSRAILNKARDHDRTVISFVYSPQAVGEIDAALQSQGWPRRLAA